MTSPDPRDEAVAHLEKAASLLMMHDYVTTARQVLEIRKLLSAANPPASGVDAVAVEIKEYTPAGGDHVMIWVNDRITAKGGYCLECVPRHVAPVIVASLSPAATSGLAMPSREWMRDKVAADPDIEDCGAAPAATSGSEDGGEAVGWAAVYDGQIKSCHRSRETCIADAEHYQAIHPVYLGPAWRHQED